MKYMRKTPVEAIQWTGDNQREVYDFMNKTARTCCNMDDGTGNLIMFWKDFARRQFKAVVPKFGWVVREGKTFQFYKDTTFHKTFDEVPDGEHKKIIDAILKNAEEQINAKLEGKEASFMDNLYKVIFDNPSQSVFAKYDNLINPDGRLTKLIDDLYKDDEKTREEIKKNMAEGLKEMEDSDKTKGTEIDTFESVLDEMKELHAKKDKDYGSAFHKSFEEFGVTAGVVRLNDKMERAKSLVKNGKAEVKDESLLDTLKDMASYAVMLYVELKNKGND